MATPHLIGERALYESVKVWLERLLEQKYASVRLEVTAYKQFSNVLQSQIDPYRELVFAFLKEAAPDITGFVKKDSSSLREFVVVEVKTGPIKQDYTFFADAARWIRESDPCEIRGQREPRYMVLGLPVQVTAFVLRLRCFCL